MSTNRRRWLMGACAALGSAAVARGQPALERRAPGLPAIWAAAGSNDGQLALAVGPRGGIARRVSTAAAASPWARLAAPTTADLAAVCAPSAKVAYAAGHEGTVLCTDDGGQSWRLRAHQPGAAQAWLAVCANRRGQVLVCGTHGRALASGDAGVTWRRLDLDWSDREPLHLLACAASDSGRFVMLGEQGCLFVAPSPFGPWVAQPALPRSVFAVVASGDEMVAAGLSGLLMHCARPDGAWRTVPIVGQGRVGSLFAAARDAQGALWACGEQGLCTKLSADRREASVQPLPTRQSLTAVIPLLGTGAKTAAGVELLSASGGEFEVRS